MHKIIVTEEAQNDINHIVENVAEFTYSFTSGLKLYEDLYAKIDMISFMPEGVGRMRGWYARSNLSWLSYCLRHHRQ